MTEIDPFSADIIKHRVDEFHKKQAVTPTQAQIEAILRDEIRLVARPDYDETETWMVKPGCIESIAAKIAALTAAAEAGDNWRVQQMIAGNATTEAGEQERHDAQVDRYVTLGNAMKMQTIERCAQVAEEVDDGECGYKHAEHIAAAIRAMKEEIR